MNKEEITVVDLIKAIESGEGKEIRLRDWQVARLFGVFEQAVRANVKSIIQLGVVKPSLCCEVRQIGKILLPEVFDLEMIIALSFRLNSPDASKFRMWLMEKVADNVDIRVTILQMNNFQLN
ncbi:hypothetical protein M2137_001797 [Parabacteroides sp. PFB2-10]|uniref:protein-tyrosine kinase n=1 Tax=Parabacteroides sp. PFB2-10 TaxID=1742405 RepID=UPI002474C452|nr:protein-tyrosine kinase [Parabacteroides sp. PFB2-10]MDH6313010.1 hypothetical protein [Parabacteroides sp. PFB2-10]